MEDHIAKFTHSFYPSTMATLFMSPLRNDKSGWRKKLTVMHTDMSYLSHLLIKILLIICGYSLKVFIWNTNIFIFLPFQGGLYTSFFTRQTSLLPISSHGPFKSLIIWQNHCLHPMNNHMHGHSPFKKNEWVYLLLEILPSVKFSLHHCPSSMSQRYTQKTVTPEAPAHPCLLRHYSQ
jgi:hypothetical protein